MPIRDANIDSTTLWYYTLNMLELSPNSELKYVFNILQVNRTFPDNTDQNYICVFWKHFEISATAKLTF